MRQASQLAGLLDNYALGMFVTVAEKGATPLIWPPESTTCFAQRPEVHLLQPTLHTWRWQTAQPGATIDRFKREEKKLAKRSAPSSRSFSSEVESGRFGRHQPSADCVTNQASGVVDSKFGHDLGAV